MPELVKYDAMCRAIDACFRVDEVKRIRDQALAFQAIARVAKNFDAERKAAFIRIRAERQGGKLLRQMQEQGERRSTRTARVDSIPTLEELGISHDQSSRWQRLAEIPQEEFEAELLEPGRPSTTRIIRGRGRRRLGGHRAQVLRAPLYDLRRINGAVQSDLWPNHLPQLFGATPTGMKLAPSVRIFWLVQKYLHTDVDIVKLILALSTLLSDERYWPATGQPKKWFRLLQRVYEDEKVDALLQHLTNRVLLDKHEEFFKHLLRDVTPPTAGVGDPIEAVSDAVEAVGDV
jgi:hypothetical protein